MAAKQWTWGAFAVMTKAGKEWRYGSFNEKELIAAAAQVYTEIASHNPQTMGKSKACYSTLLLLTTIFARLG